MSSDARRDQHAGPGRAAGRGGARPLAAAPGARRVRRAGAGQGASSACSSRRRAAAARRSTTCCWPARPASARRRSRTSRPASSTRPLVQTAGPALERKGDVAAFLTALEPGSVFFIDEIHRLTRAVEETLYPAMEDRRLPIVLGQGAGARTVTLDLPAFTLIGATTRTGLLTTPLRERFGVVHRLEHYPPDGPRADRAALGRHPRRPDRGRGRRTRSPPAPAARPRVANRLLRRVRDFAAGARHRHRQRRDRGGGARDARGRRRRASSGSTASC